MSEALAFAAPSSTPSLGTSSLGSPRFSAAPRLAAAPQMRPSTPKEPAPSLPTLLREVGGQRVLAVDGQRFSSRSEHTVVVVERGAMEVVRPAVDGGDVVVGLVEQGQVYGLDQLFGPLDADVAVRALGEAELLLVNPHDLKAHLMASSRVPLVLEALSSQVQMYRSFAATALVDVEVRLARLMLAYIDAVGDSQGASVQLPFKRTQPELAAAIGAGERSINRVLRKWKQDRVLEKVFGRYVIYDVDAIRSAAVL